MKVATSSATFKIVDSVGKEVTGTVVVVPSQFKAKASGSAILTDGDSVTASFVATSSGAVSTAPSPLVLSLVLKSSAEKMKASNKLVILEGDESTPVGLTVTTPSGSPFADTVKVVVTAAGQSKVKAT